MAGPHVLLPWEPHPEYEGTEVRFNTGKRKIVLSLAPEGILPSQCWAWMVHTARELPLKHGVNHGSDMKREVARQQADAAAQAYGYELDDHVSDAPSLARQIVGLPLAEAAELVQRAGVTLRIRRVICNGNGWLDDNADGNCSRCPGCDACNGGGPGSFERDRVTAFVREGIVAGAVVG